MDARVEDSAGRIVSNDRLGESEQFSAIGQWVIGYASLIQTHIESLPEPMAERIAISLADIDALDTSGAWLLFKLKDRWEASGTVVSFVRPSEEHIVLLSAISDAAAEVRKIEPERGTGETLVQFLVNRCTAAWDDALRLLSLMGALLSTFFKRMVTWEWRFAAIVTHMMRTGLTAVPIIVLMSFVIGAIVAQQGAYQLSFYGADIMAVDLVAVLVTRDMGVLLTAIMVAGRSGSAYTAEIGSMRMREEIDALKVIGLDPVDVLIFPRIAGLILVLPLLTIIADYASLLGAQLALWLYIDMSWQIFVERARDATPLSYFLMGVVKAPFMALIIGLIAMSEGLKVSGSSESLSKHTTIAVVKSIFMVIVIDGVFAVISANLGY
ncbi:MAG: ABC transporter permease [Pseudomonadota bacterium]